MYQPLLIVLYYTSFKDKKKTHFLGILLKIKRKEEEEEEKPICYGKLQFLRRRLLHIAHTVSPGDENQLTQRSRGCDDPKVGVPFIR